jgi:hypothetical protein
VRGHLFISQQKMADTPPTFRRLDALLLALLNSNPVLRRSEFIELNADVSALSINSIQNATMTFAYTPPALTTIKILAGGLGEIPTKLFKCYVERRAISVKISKADWESGIVSTDTQGKLIHVADQIRKTLIYYTWTRKCIQYHPITVEVMSFETSPLQDASCVELTVNLKCLF